VLEFRDLRRSFGDVVALDGLSFQVAPGELCGFLGPNGAGKTTAMRCAVGVTAADAGEVRWRGQPIDLAVRRRTGYMPEERGLYPRMRVHEQLVYLARLRAVDAEVAARNDRWTDRLGIGERRDDPVEQLSLGNQQRVQLAAPRGAVKVPSKSVTSSARLTGPGTPVPADPGRPPALPPGPRCRS
jgi:ABC-2 type transport system ATP-binding protein